MGSQDPFFPVAKKTTFTEHKHNDKTISISRSSFPKCGIDTRCFRRDYMPSCDYASDKEIVQSSVCISKSVLYNTHIHPTPPKVRKA